MPQSKSAADGVYLKEQAERGAKKYEVFCSSCHAEDLSGTNSGDSGGPPLRHDDFMDGSTADAIFNKIRRTMPLDAPGRNSTEDYVDILAFIFRENGFPAGQQALSADPALLEGIKIIRESK